MEPLLRQAISGKPEISEEYWLVRQTHPDAGIHIHVQMLAEVFEENTFNDLLKKSRRLVQKKGQTAQEFRQAYIAFWREATILGLQAPADGYPRDFLGRLYLAEEVSDFLSFKVASLTLLLRSRKEPTS